MNIDDNYEGEVGSVEFKSNFYWIQKSDKKIYEVDARTHKETGKIEEYIFNRKW